MTARDLPAFTRFGLLRQIVIVVAAYLAYFAVRGLTEGNIAQALAHAGDLIGLERRLGVLWEPDLQRWIIDKQMLVDFANLIYIWAHWPVIVLAAGWLLLRRPAAFRLFRNAFLISGAIGLMVFALYPVAPPRLAGLDVVDTVTLHSNAYRVLQPPAFTNQYAAVPSLHFGWNLLIGIALVRSSSWLPVKLFGWIMPALMLAATILTANHYIFDAVAGAVVALIGLLLAAALRSAHLHFSVHLPTRHHLGRMHAP
jgi:hypothetical protein